MTPAERNAVLEEAAQLIERCQEEVSLRTNKRFLGKRTEGSLTGLAYVAAIRALKEQEPTT